MPSFEVASTTFGTKNSTKKQNYVTKFYVLVMLPVAVTRPSYDGDAIRYVLPVLWMTSCFHTMQGKCQYQRRRVCFVQFARCRQIDAMDENTT